MSEKGWIKIDRNLSSHWIWMDEPFSRGQAWIDLLMMADHTDHKNPYKGEIVTFKRGSVNLSISKLAERWGWSRKKTRFFLKLLENDGMVSLKVSTHRTTITLINYEVYQGQGTTKVSTKEQQGNSKGTARVTYLKNDKNEKNEKKANLPSADSVLSDEERFKGMTDCERLRIINQELAQYDDDDEWE